MNYSQKDLEILKESILPININDDYNILLQKAKDAKIVLIGEASHGSQDFYSTRAELTKRLIKEKDFNAVAVEADWPDAYKINRYVQKNGEGITALEALDDFKRFPTWMWRNTIVLEFISWLNNYNSILNENNRVGFYGLDLYSLHGSINAVINYLEKVDPEAAKRARYRYSCFDHYGEDPQSYGYAANFNITESCETEVVDQLSELYNQSFNYIKKDGFVAEDEFFFAEQNAKIAKNAEEYYRSMFKGHVVTWNLRDEHMMQTLESLDKHISHKIGAAKIVVWEHNSHLGDARATEMSQRGELNVGQLVKEKYGKKSFSIGFTTNTGTVTAASNWGEIAERKKIRPGLNNSYEELFHQTKIPKFIILSEETKNDPELKRILKSKLERAIGVIYLPRSERISHYFFADIAEQFDAVIHIDNTTAVEPIDKNSTWEKGELPETFPSGV